MATQYSGATDELRTIQGCIIVTFQNCIQRLSNISPVKTRRIAGVKRIQRNTKPAIIIDLTKNKSKQYFATCKICNKEFATAFRNHLNSCATENK